MEFLSENTYVDQAEKVINDLIPRDDKGNPITNNVVTTSKIRNILSMAADIYDNLMRQRTVVQDDFVSRVEYLRVRMIYESGRDKKVRAFVDKAKLIEYVKMIGNDKKRYELFYHYLEALIAFHRFNGGEEN